MAGASLHAEEVRALLQAVRLRKAGRLDEGHAVLMALLGRAPEVAAVWNEAAHLLEARGRRTQAEVAYARALVLDANLVEARVNLAVLLVQRRADSDALAHLEVAVRIAPDEPVILSNLGGVLHRLGQHERARSILTRCLARAPDHAAAHHNLGLTMADDGEVAAALPHLEHAVALAPGDLGHHDSLLLQTHYVSASPLRLAALHRRYGEIMAASIPPPPRPPARDPERRLRVGLVSPDLRQHPVAMFVEPIVAHHDRTRLEIHAYSCSVSEDAVSDRLRAQVAAWKNVAALSDDALARVVRDDAMDVLIDLAGHTANNRLAVFARRPAPLQISYLGYPDTTGLATVDHHITDASADPDESETWHSESLLRLGSGFLTYAPPPSPPVAPPPSTTGAPFTFASFNALNKLSDEILAIWSRILEANPASRLLVKDRTLSTPAARARLQARMAAAGIPATRVCMLGFIPGYQDHLAAYAMVDVALDTYPYHGTATTCEALWMGVPVVTVAGPTHASRVGVSLLTRSGNADLVATTPEAYVALASSLAAAPDRLRALRATARERMAPLIDGERFTRDFEEALRTAWRGIAR